MTCEEQYMTGSMTSGLYLVDTTEKSCRFLFNRLESFLCCASRILTCYEVLQFNSFHSCDIILLQHLKLEITDKCLFR